MTKEQQHKSRSKTVIATLKLIEQYKELTLEYIRSNEFRGLHHHTYFGSYKCGLCVAVKRRCNMCIHVRVTEIKCYQHSKSTYQSLKHADEDYMLLRNYNSDDERFLTATQYLYEAVQERIEYLEMLLRVYKYGKR